jgi:predicted RecA/RadA family phage recombinase
MGTVTSFVPATSGSSEPAPGSPNAVASDVNGVEEPSTVALSRGGVTHQVTAFIRRVSVPPAVFHVRDEWAYRGSNGAAATGRFALPGGYTESSDPVLAVNGGGEPGGAVYAAGRVMNRDASNDSSTNPASIRVWVSTDGGASFPGMGAQVDMMPAGATRTVDKPWLTVSSDGIVYVAWVRVDLTGGGQSQIVLRRSRNGVVKSHICCGGPLTWDNSVAVSTPGDVTGPQIVVDTAGFVSVIWTDLGARQLRIARSLHPAAGVEGGGAVAFGDAQTVAAFQRIGSGASANTIAGGIRVLPLASAQYDAATNEIVITWTEGESDGSAHTDLRLVRSTAGAVMTFASVNLTSVNAADADQFTPAVAVAEGGDIVLAWYDRAGDTTEYQERIVELSQAGIEVSRAAPGPVCQAAIVGEYQGLSRVPSASGGRWQLAWACSDPESGGRVIFQIAPP